VLIIEKIGAINDSLSEIEKYLQVLAKSRAIQIGLEKKLLEKIAIARQATKCAADTSM
jgi:hypothetical protein